MSLFVSGTGTDVGKTLVTAALAWQLGKPWRALKPLASGVVPQDTNSDPSILARAQKLPVADICLHALRAPVAPDRAAEMEGVILLWQEIVDFCEGEKILVEGAGGLYSPLTATHTNADLARALDIPVLLVAHTMLGTLSQVIATLRAAEADGLHVCGIVLSQRMGQAAPIKVAESLRALRPAAPPFFLLSHLPGTDAWMRVPDMRQWLGEIGVGG